MQLLWQCSLQRFPLIRIVLFGTKSPIMYRYKVLLSSWLWYSNKRWPSFTIVFLEWPRVELRVWPMQGCGKSLVHAMKTNKQTNKQTNKKQNKTEAHISVIVPVFVLWIILQLIYIGIILRGISSLHRHSRKRNPPTLLSKSSVTAISMQVHVWPTTRRQTCCRRLFLWLPTTTGQVRRCNRRVFIGITDNFASPLYIMTDCWHSTAFCWYAHRAASIPQGQLRQFCESRCLEGSPVLLAKETWAAMACAPDAVSGQSQQPWYSSNGRLQPDAASGWHSAAVHTRGAEELGTGPVDYVAEAGSAR